jgi:hypothetical protein
MIKPIETIYNGYRFRSRLEARWAVFFDTLGVKYEYEKEGYDLNGKKYLPDFWLPEQKCFIEIKGQKPTPDEIKKAELLALHTLAGVYLFYGDIEIPGQGSFYKKGMGYVAFLDRDGPGTHFFPEGEIGWAQCPWCLSLNISYHSNSDGVPCGCLAYIRQLLHQGTLQKLLDHCPDIIAKEPTQESKSRMIPDHLSLFYKLEIVSWWRDKCHALVYAGDTPRLIAAYTAARQARFEHGENGR